MLTQGLSEFWVAFFIQKFTGVQRNIYKSPMKIILQLHDLNQTCSDFLAISLEWGCGM